jgi:uncharacterized Zn finger protein (UPF0148 family)
MALCCKTCGQPTRHKSDLYCPTHERQVLRTLDRAGYLQPLTVQTMDGPVRLSNREFLTLPEPGTMRT